jgi:hypothetical protein
VSDGARPILVTGMPRSGTTWLARLFATAPGTALTGREPMNPRGRQYALAGTLHGWAELTTLSRRQERALGLAYRGRTPWVFSRYGRRQWAAPLPWTRVVVKDPYAMLSAPVITRVTAATVVLLYRHPGAALASYRRVGWEPAVDELRPIQQAHERAHGGDCAVPDVAEGGACSQALTVSRFWAGLYGIALDHAPESDRLVIVSHEELSGGGVPAARRLFEKLGLRWNPAAEQEMLGKAANSRAGGAVATQPLHDLVRSPREVSGAWRDQLSPEELIVVEETTREVRDRLHDARLPLVG